MGAHGRLRMFGHPFLQVPVLAPEQSVTASKTFDSFMWPPFVHGHLAQPIKTMDSLVANIQSSF